MKKLVLFLLLSTAALAPGCGSKGSDPAPVVQPPASGFSAAPGQFTLKLASGATYTLSGLSLKTEAIESAASKQVYFQYTYRGISSAGGTGQVELYITDPTPLTGNGPFNQQTTVYTSTSTYAQLSLVGRATGSLSAANNANTAEFTGAAVSGKLTQ